MAVAPDVLLKPTPPGKSAAALSSTLKHAGNPSHDKGSSFADVYARESRPAPAERPSHAARPARERVADNARNDSPKPAAGADKPEVADSGKSLPAEAEDKPESADDKPAEQAEAQQPPASEPVPLLVALGAEQQNVANTDADLEKLNQQGGVKLSLEQGAQSQQQGVAQGKLDLAALQAGQGAEQQPEAGDGKLLQGVLQAGLLRPADGQADGKTDSRSETFAARLEALTHALGSQHTLTTRPVNALVPGQPLALQQSGISEALVDRVMWMSSQNLKSADIQMEPADLGRLEVRIHMTAEQTQVTFASANAGVRDALESQMQRLRDMFNQQGMTSPNVNVSDQSLSRGWQGQQGESGRGQGRGGRGGGGEDEPVLTGVAEIRNQPGRQGRGLVDYFA